MSDEREHELAVAEKAAMVDLRKAELALEQARLIWGAAQDALAKHRQKRLPREDELTYALGATCEGCGAPLAYWPGTNAKEWACADVLLARTSDEPKPNVWERSMFQKPRAEVAPMDLVLHDVYPFAFCKIKSDPERKNR